MRTCKCGKPIENRHGNAKTCVTCQKKPNAKKVTVHKEQTVTMPYKQFKELEHLAEIGKHYLEIHRALNDKICTHCLKCNELDGICALYGVPNTEVI